MSTIQPATKPLGRDVWQGNAAATLRVPREKGARSTTLRTQAVNVAVVGAGPYGLSVAAHLRGAGVDARVFGEPMAGWLHHMPKAMYLKSTFEASSLSAPEPGSSLADYCKMSGAPVLDEWSPVPIGMFIDYGCWFQRRHVAEIGRQEIQSMEALPDGFRLALSDGDRLVARNVVVAAGHVDYAYMPSELQSVASEPALVSHAAQHSDFSEFSGRTVAVIGAGQSALESAVLLREAGAEVHLLARKPLLLWGNPPGDYHHLLAPIVKPKSPLGPGWSHFALSRAPELVTYLPPPARLFLMRHVLGPSGAWWLRRRFEQKIDVALGTRIESASLSNGKIQLGLHADSGSRSVLGVDHVLAATGYRINLDALRFLGPALRLRLARIEGTSAPRLSRSFESSVRGLYFTGLSAAPTFGPLMRFVCGADFAARTVCSALARSL
jgi:pyridine nucleotide-disulfide oxidoreductase